jgi:large subunit ribosomal protein L4
MVKVDVLKVTGGKAGSVELDDHVFGIEPNVPVMHQVVNAQLATKRAGTHNTKTRAEVRGGGAKPWKQKGTGRARAGSSRIPQWRGGGVAMGPKPRDYSQKTPKKMKRLALYSALSDRALDDSVLVVDNWDFEQPKTKEARDALVAIGAKGKVLLVVDDVNVNARKSFRNLSNAHVISPMQLNVFDVLVSDVVVFTKENLLTSSTSDKTNENSSIPSNEEETEES